MIGCGLPDAVEYLAESFSIPVEYAPHEKSPAAEEQKKFLQALEMAQAYFVQCLGKGGENAVNYLTDRGISKMSIQRFGIGYCKNSAPEMLRIGKTLSLTGKQLATIGLLTVSRENKNLYGRMGERITFPIYSRRGQIIGFGARAIGDNPAKYINSPTSILYAKKESVYGLNVAREGIVRSHTVIIVEGYTDVIAMFQSGVADNVVGCSGTALTGEQLAGLSSIASNFIFMFDGDTAGRAALLRAVDKAFILGLNCAVVEIPDGLDPDSFVHALGGEAVSRFIKQNTVEGLKYSFESRMRSSGFKDILQWMDDLFTATKDRGPVFHALLAKKIGYLCGLAPEHVFSQFKIASGGV
jgi:DNA primase